MRDTIIKIIFTYFYHRKAFFPQEPKKAAQFSRDQATMTGYGSVGGAPEHIVYVRVNREGERFGTSSRKAYVGIAMALGLACLVFVGHRSSNVETAAKAVKSSAPMVDAYYNVALKHKVASSRAVAPKGKAVAAPHALQSMEATPTRSQLRQLQDKLAAKEVHAEVLSAAEKVLPAPAKQTLDALVTAPATTKLAANCDKLDAYNVLKDTFAALDTNLTQHKTAIDAEDARLESANTEAKNAWLASDAGFRTAEATAKSAASAAEYAKGKYDEWAAAKDSSQSEYDTQIVSLTEEKKELAETIPIIEMIEKMVQDMLKEMAGAAAKAKGTQKLSMQQLKLSMMPATKVGQLVKLAESVETRQTSKTVSMEVAQLKSMLSDESTGYIDKHMVMKLPGKIIASMSARLEEIAATESKLAADVAADKAKFEHWEKELVTVSDAKDEALNAMNSADLDRQQLAGKHAVAEEAYMNYHEGYEVEASKLTDQLTAVTAIAAKIDAIIAECSA